MVFKNRFIIIALFLTGFILGTFFVYLANAGTLSCIVRTSTTTCSGGEVNIFRMSSTTNAHAGLAGSSYTNLVCCTGPTGLGIECSGAYATTTVLKLSGATNAHVQQTGSYANNVCLSVPTGGSVSVGYQATNCTSPVLYDTTLASMSSTTNAHVGNADAYATKICATAAAAVVVSITVSPTSTVYSTMDVSTVRKADTVNANDEFIITNTGNVAETFDIISSDATGGSFPWTLSTSTVATNQYIHAYSALKTLTASTTLGNVGEQATKWVAMDKSPSYRTLKTNVATSTTADLVLELLTPSSVGDYVQKTITVTVRATEYP